MNIWLYFEKWYLYKKQLWQKDSFLLNPSSALTSGSISWQMIPWRIEGVLAFLHKFFLFFCATQEFEKQCSNPKLFVGRVGTCPSIFQAYTSEEQHRCECSHGPPASAKATQEKNAFEKRRKGDSSRAPEIAFLKGLKSSLLSSHENPEIKLPLSLRQFNYRPAECVTI